MPRLLFILSPAKSLDLSAVSSRKALASTVPHFLSQADALVEGVLGKLSKSGIASLLKVSSSLADLNHQRYTGWSEATQKRAIFCYDGKS